MLPAWTIDCCRLSIGLPLGFLPPSAVRARLPGAAEGAYYSLLTTHYSLLTPPQCVLACPGLQKRLNAERKTSSRLRAMVVAQQNNRAELEEFFLRSIESVKKDIARRRRLREGGGGGAVAAAAAGDTRQSSAAFADAPERITIGRWTRTMSRRRTRSQWCRSTSVSSPLR